MLKRSTIPMMTALFALIICFTINASAAKCRSNKAAKTVCSKTTDAELTDKLNQALEAKFGDQKSHLNVSVKRRVVKLEGWLDGAAAVREARNLVKGTKCVRSVTSKLKANGGGTCGPGQKICGGTCIDKSSSCTIKGT